MTIRTIYQHIDADKKELDNTNISSKRRRHLNDELESLERYSKNHPEDPHDPSSLELFCDENPEAPECRVYED
jgi:hypothetical protein